MGLPLTDCQPKVQPQTTINLQKYYSQTFRQYVSSHENVSFSSRQTTTSIFRRARCPTDTHSNRDLALLDIDKLISFNTGSLRQQGQRVRNMNMVAQLMENQRRNSPGYQSAQLTFSLNTALHLNSELLNILESEQNEVPSIR